MLIFGLIVDCIRCECVTCPRISGVDRVKNECSHVLLGGYSRALHLPGLT